MHGSTCGSTHTVCLQSSTLLIKILKLQVKCNNFISKEFTTNIGSPQGDCASPLLFILVLSEALKKSKELIKSYSVPNTNRLVNFDHTYTKNIDKTEFERNFSIGQEYADDCSVGSTDKKLIQAFENQVPGQLENFSLLVNRDKTEKLSIKHKGAETWGDTVFLGSKLDTAKT